ncbi:MAG: DUF3012 domain-containing protein [Sneathiellales bacterium]|nr:DUF3012 domain-containing protein [Sneathiellales bacterium]
MKKLTKSMAGIVALAGIAALLSACSPEVGSKEWCEAMKEKPKGDWSANEATDFAKHCVL